jgi:hypothetical protein
VSENDGDTFCDIWWHPNGIMKWWFRVAIVYRAIMVLLLLAEVCVIAADLMASSRTVPPAPEPHGIAALAGTLAARAG